MHPSWSPRQNCPCYVISWFRLVHAFGTRQNVLCYGIDFPFPAFSSDSSSDRLVVPPLFQILRKMETHSGLLQELQLFIDDKEQLLIWCRIECGYALSVKYSQVTSHLRDKHQVIESDRKGLPRHLTRTYAKRFRNPAVVPPQDDGSDAHPQLRVYDEVSCRECTYHTINYPQLSKHISKNHIEGVNKQRVHGSMICTTMFTCRHGLKV